MKKIILLIIVAVLAIAGIYFKPTIAGWLSSSKQQISVDTSQTDSLGNPVAKNGKKVLVAYFSWGGNTRKVANQIHEKVGGDIFEIRTETPYPKEYKPTTEIAKKEAADNSRPKLVGRIADMSNYDVIFIGYPIWWYTAPMAVNSFIESYDFSGKTIIPFATSGGSGITQSVQDIRKLAPKATFLDGLLANSSGDITPWLKKIGMTE